MTKLFTGNIELDSYGIFQELRKTYSNQELSEISDAYYSAFNSGACNEEDLHRTASNHNPKPARILTLLFKESSIRELSLLINSLLLFTRNPKSNNYLYDELNFSTLDNLETKLAFCLDDLRHLHMKKDKTNNRVVVLKYKSLFQITSENRLYILAEHAYNRCLRTYGS